MKNLSLNIILSLVCLSFFSFQINIQRTTTKKKIGKTDKIMIEKTFAAISISDQLYRSPISTGTLDKKIIHQIDSVFNNEGVAEGFAYQKSLNLSMPKVVKDSLNFVQLILLVHPPAGWDIRNYLKEYSELLMPEVIANRMPAKTFATFYDNIKGKILKEPQLYGTNEQYDSKTKTILPPVIENLAKSNKARKKIGLPILKKGEYRLATK